ncbi:MAG: hypothetical protein ACOYEV_07335 [Candidatus Nanopelagicales bacterium]
MTGRSVMCSRQNVEWKKLGRLKGSRLTGGVGVIGQQDLEKRLWDAANALPRAGGSR